jgi:hypothetical protein
MPLFGQKTGFRARMNEIKSGIPCSGLDWLLNGSAAERWVYNNTNARNESPVTRLCVALFSDGCVCILVKYLQDGFTIIQTHAMTSSDDAFLFFSDGRRWTRLYLCKIFARWVYNNTNARNDTEHGIPDFISFIRARTPVF